MANRRDDRHTFVDFGEEPIRGPDAAAASDGAEDGERFRVDEELARGGLGRVHRAWDRALDRPVAVKALLRASPAARARFAREALITARLQHPNIVPVYDGGLDAEGLPYLAMRLVEGASLDASIAARATLAERLELLDHVVAACNAVAYAHSHRVVHRDLKPDNLLVGAYGETVVIDWGLAKDLDADDDPTVGGGEEVTLSGLHSTGSLTRVGSVVGTPAYMAPEQAAGDPVDTRCDVYALGAVLYHLLAGERPYAGAQDVLSAALAGPPPPLRELVDGVPPDLLAVVERAMARRPEDRYPDAVALAAELERFRTGRLVAAYEYTARERLARLVRQNPITSGLALALVMTLVVAVGVLLRANDIAESRRAQAEAARAEAQALREAERRQRDDLALEQAALLVERDPSGALTLLGSLEADRYDGRARTLAAAALSEGIARRVLALPEAYAPRVVASGDRVAVADRSTLHLLDGHGGALAVELDATPHRLHATRDGVFVCGTGGLSLVDWRGATRPFDVGERCELLVDGGGSHALAKVDNRLVRVDAAGAVSGVRSLADLRAPWFVAATTPGHAWVVGRAPSSLRYADLGAGEQTPPLELPGEPYASIAAPDGERLLYLAGTPALSVVTRDGDQLTHYIPPAQPAGWLSYGAWLDDQRVLVGGDAPELLVVDVTSGAVQQRLPLDGLPAALAPVGDDGFVVATASGAVYRVDVRPDGRGVDRLGSIGTRPTGVAVSDDALVLGGRGGAYAVGLQPPDGRVHSRHGGRIYTIDPAPDGTLWVTGMFGVDRVDPDGTRTRLTETPTLRTVRCGGRRWFGSFGRVWSHDDVVDLGEDRAGVLTCADDARWLAAGTQRGEVLLLDPRDGRLLRHLTSLPKHFVVELLDRGDDRVTVAGAGVHILPLDPTKPIEALLAPEQLLRVAQLADGRLVRLDLSGTVTLDDGTAIPLPTQGTSLAVADDTVAVGDHLGTVWLWRDGDRAPRPLTGHRQYVAALAFRPGGTRWLATGAWDDDAYLWDTSTSPPTGRRLALHDDAVMTLAWSADGSALYTGSRDGVVRRWQDGLATEPGAVQRQLHALSEAVATDRPLPDAAALAAIGDD